MANAVVLIATALAVALAVTALVALSMELYVAAGTCFVFTAFAIYIRETKG